MIYSQSVGCHNHVYYSTFIPVANIDLVTTYKELPALYPDAHLGTDKARDEGATS